MIRSPLINPLLLLLAAQARAVIETSPTDSWQGLSALCEDSSDTDRLLATWREQWPLGTQQSFEAACRHPLFASSSPLVAAQPAQIAQAMAGSHLLLPAGVCVLPWAVQGRRYHPALVDRIVEAKLKNQQVWLDVPSHEVARAAQDTLVRDGLRLGCAWFLRPPSVSGQQEVYAKALREWTHQILNDASFDQWVWPWADLVVKGLIAYASLGVLSKRQEAPPGWPCGEMRWPLLTRAVLQNMCDHWGHERVARDIFMGLISAFSPLSETPASPQS